MKRSYITGSSFYEGEIRGADIYAARIHGDDTSGALSIYDTDKGIGFYRNLSGQDDLTCQINARGFDVFNQQVSHKFFYSNESNIKKWIDMSSSGLFVKHTSSTVENAVTQYGLGFDKDARAISFMFGAERGVLKIFED
jgi:hypothetical protein